MDVVDFLTTLIGAEGEVPEAEINTQVYQCQSISKMSKGVSNSAC